MSGRRPYQKVKREQPGAGGGRSVQKQDKAPQEEEPPAAGSSRTGAEGKSRGSSKAGSKRKNLLSSPAAASPAREGGLADPELSCVKCKSQDDAPDMLICDACDRGWHIHCLKPKLTSIPEGDWYCPPCIEAQRKKAKSSNASREASASSASPKRRKESAYPLETDSEDDDFLKPRSEKKVLPGSEGKGKKTPSKASATASTPADRRPKGKGAPSSSAKRRASAKKAASNSSISSAAAEMEPEPASKEAVKDEDDDFKAGKKNQSKKPRVPDEEPVCREAEAAASFFPALLLHFLC